MTLLETLVALVILGLTAVGFLSAFQATSRSIREAETWVQAVGYAEASMEQSKLASGSDARALREVLPQGFAREVGVRPWPSSPGLEQVTVTVTLPGGGTFQLHRLVRAP
ncbi:MAG: type II secretion system protein [Gemmatimonadetes bacterium]|nr:type II secretion system protein [Gemmatimonadota bacterium]